MGDYTPEPTRRECVMHLSFDNIRNETAVDTSPQMNDGTLIGSPSKRTGAVGEGLFLDVDSYVKHGSPITSSHNDSFTVSAFVEMEEKAGGNQVQSFVKHGGDTHANLRFDGTNFEFAVETSADGWVRATGFTPSFGDQHLVTGVFSGTEVKLYVDGSLVATASASDSPTGGGDGYIGTFDTSTQNSRAVVDEVRMYRRALSVEEISNIHEIANEHGSRRQLIDAWENPGIPFRGNNIRLAGALAEEKDAVRRQADFIRESRHIHDASGEQLDDIGAIADVQRKENESDDRYRARIIGVLVAGRSNGTFSDILEATATILETSVDRVEIQKAWTQDPAGTATAFVYVRTADLDAVDLTTADLTAILKDVVIAGHDVEVQEQGANPFLLIDDTQVNKAENGLTSDSISTGGGLASDV